MDTATGLLRTALWVIGILTLISGIEGYARFAVELLGAPIERLILVKALQP